MTENETIPTPDDRERSGGVSLRGVLLLNLALLVVLAGVTFAPLATAQQNRPRGDYSMVAGPAQGTDSSVVYIIDATNQEMVAITYDNNQKSINGVGYRNLQRDAAEALRGNAPTR